MLYGNRSGTVVLISFFLRGTTALGGKTGLGGVFEETFSVKNNGGIGSICWFWLKTWLPKPQQQTKTKKTIHLLSRGRLPRTLAGTGFTITLGFTVTLGFTITLGGRFF